MKPPDLAALDAAATWRWVADQLTAAVGSARHPFHLLTVATVGGDGHPAARTVVLRGWDPVGPVIRFHSDVRSPKVQAIRVEPRVALQWYDPASRVQLRIAARAAIHHDDAVAAAAWSVAAAMSRACYTAAAAPGMLLDAFPEAPLPPAAGDDAGYQRFAVVSCTFTAIELMSLHATGHQRVRLDLDRDAATRIILAP